MSCRGLIRRRCHFPTSEDDAARTEIQVSVTHRIQPCGWTRAYQLELSPGDEVLIDTYQTYSHLFV